MGDFAEERGAWTEVKRAAGGNRVAPT